MKPVEYWIDSNTDVESIADVDSYVPETDTETVVSEVCTSHGQSAPDRLDLRPLHTWTVSDVQRWLTASKLQLFSQRFHHAHVTGMDLCNLDMDFFTRTNVFLTEEKEELIAQLYKLQQQEEVQGRRKAGGEGAGVGITTGNHAGEAIRNRDKLSGSVKSMSSVGKDDASNRLLVVGSRTSRSTPRKYKDSHGASERSWKSQDSSRVSQNGSRLSEHESLMSNHGSQVSQNISQVSQHSSHVSRGSSDSSAQQSSSATHDDRLGQSRNSQQSHNSQNSQQSTWMMMHRKKAAKISSTFDKNILVWHQLSGSMTGSSVRLHSDTTCGDIIESLLRRENIQEDPNLFYLIDRDARGKEVELIRHENLASVRQRWGKNSIHKLEIRQKSGLQIKVACTTSSGKTRLKSFRVATNSSYTDALKVACNKCRVHQQAQLLEVLSQGGGPIVTKTIPPTKYISELTSTNFVLQTSENDKVLALAQSLLDQEGSLASHSSDNVSETSSQRTTTTVTTTQQPWPGATSKDLLQSPHSTLEKRGKKSLSLRPRSMASLEDAQIELLQEIALLKESLKEKDEEIEKLVQVNQGQEVNGGHKHDEDDTERKQNVTRKIASLQTKIQSIKSQLNSYCGVQSPDSGLLQELQTELDQTYIQMIQLEQELEASGHGEGRSGHGEGKSRQVNGPVNGWTNGQTHGPTNGPVNGSTTDETRSSEDLPTSGQLPLSKVLDTSKREQLLDICLLPENGSYGLMIGRDAEKRLIVKHAESGRPVVRGDRLLELEGRLVYSLTDTQVASFIRSRREQGGALQAVVLRDVRDQDQQDDLAMVHLDLETAQQEVDDLQDENNSLKNQLLETHEKQDLLEREIEELKNQLQVMNQARGQGQMGRSQVKVQSQHFQPRASRRGLDWFHSLVNTDSDKGGGSTSPEGDGGGGEPAEGLPGPAAGTGD